MKCDLYWRELSIVYKLRYLHLLYRLTNAAVRLLERFSEGSLVLDMESTIEKRMRTTLSWSAAFVIAETEFNQTYTGKDSERSAKKKISTSDKEVLKILNSRWKSFKNEFSIFDKLPHFAIYRLKVKTQSICMKHL